MIPATAADAAFAKCWDLGHCATMLRDQFPDSAADDRIEAIRAAQSRVIEKLWAKHHRPRKKWWLMTREQELREREQHGR